MAKKRPSVQKRQREILKRQREFDKAAKAAEKRQRRLNPDEPDTAPIEDAPVSSGVTGESSGDS